MTKPTFYINSSALSLKSTCDLRLRYTICDGYVPRGRDIGDFTDVHFGTCWHLYRQVLAASKGDWSLAMVKALSCWEAKEKQLIMRSKTKAYVTKDFLAQTILNFQNRYMHIADNESWWDKVDGFSYFKFENGIPFTEQKIQFPYYVGEDFDLILVGTLDALGFIGDSFILLDDKTTSSWDVEEFFEKYRSSNQMMLYTWMVRQLSNMYPESQLGKIFSQYPNFGTAIYGIFHSAKEVNFKRSPIMFYNERQLASFEAVLAEKLQDVIRICSEFIMYPKLRNKTGFVNGMCKAYKNECPYVNACCADTEDDEESMLYAQFEVKPYNPVLTHEDI